MIKYAIAGFAAIVSLLSGLEIAHAADAPATDKWQALDPTFIYVVVGVAFAAIFIAFAVVCRRLAEHPTWSLADALSEEADLTANDANGQPVTKTVLAASTSRLIAFIGTTGILFLFLGFGALIMCEYGTTGRVDNADAIGKYLLAGLTLFAPYVVNKFSSVFAPK